MEREPDLLFFFLEIATTGTGQTPADQKSPATRRTPFKEKQSGKPVLQKRIPVVAG